MKLRPYFLHFSPGLDKIQYKCWAHLLSESFVKIRTMKAILYFDAHMNSHLYCPHLLSNLSKICHKEGKLHFSYRTKLNYIYMCTIQTIWHSESKECLGKVCVLCHVTYNPFCNFVVFSFPRGRISLLASDLGSELTKNRNTLLFYTLVLVVLSKYTTWRSYHDLI